MTARDCPNCHYPAPSRKQDKKETDVPQTPYHIPPEQEPVEEEHHQGQQQVHAVVAGEGEKARRYGIQSLYFAVALGLILGILMVGISPFLPAWLGAEPELYRDASLYFGICCSPMIFRTSSLVMPTRSFERFVRLAEARTNKIIDMIQLLGNCANANTYEYTQQDVDQIFSAIEAELREAKKKYQKVESNRTSKFTLK